ncbi:CAIB/BAIF family protein [Mucor mucedo]|uniref:CAIB/BAIF family protein n=1 Tax=Mucor mucedo TaxID=29922 RepID=UPI0022207275|nr:CAIB/BAIF family protein [Mucor mucedo]KAI7894908.1 CAIB/BAIF family protein [Mucor mucedo]
MLAVHALKSQGVKHLAWKRFKSTEAIKPLQGIRVLELGQLVAGPFCGSILGYYGAEVIKVEPPKIGDPLRIWRHLDKDGQSAWSRSLSRNKKSITLDLKTQEGRDLVKQLAEQSDVLIENFKPGTMEKWGLGPEDIYPANPKLIYTRISGYGQTGPYSKRPGYASVCEGMGGFRFVNGHPGDPPVRPNMSLGDSLAGLHAALGVLLGLIAKNKLASQTERTGQVVDVAIYESMLNMMEGVVPEFDRFDEIRQPSGTTVTGIVPTNTYPCKDGKHVIIGGNGDSIYVRLMNAIGRSDLTGEKYKVNADRVKEQEAIDGAIAAWTLEHTTDEVLEVMEKVSVPAGKIYDAKDIVEDEHINARGMIENVTVGTKEEGRGWNVKIPGMSPVLGTTPGSTEWAGPDLGEHTNQVLKDLLGLSDSEIKKLEQDGITKPK